MWLIEISDLNVILKCKMSNFVILKCNYVVLQFQITFTLLNYPSLLCNFVDIAAGQVNFIVTLFTRSHYIIKPTVLCLQHLHCFVFQCNHNMFSWQYPLREICLLFLKMGWKPPAAMFACRVSDPWTPLKERGKGEEVEVEKEEEVEREKEEGGKREWSQCLVAREFLLNITMTARRHWLRWTVY